VSREQNLLREFSSSIGEINAMAKLFLLGAGTPTPTQDRFGTSSVLQLDEEYIMFDVGPAATHKLVKAGLFPTQIEHLFITHHHFDHNVDLPCFLLCRWDQSTDNEKPLNLWGPKPLEEIIEKLIGEDGAFSYDWNARVNSSTSQSVFVNRGGTLPRPKPAYQARNISPGKITEQNKWTVRAARGQHMAPWLETLAYRVDTNQGSILFASDTGPCKSVRDLGHGVDVIVANVWDHQATMDANGESTGQTGTLDAARLADESGANTLVITHSLPSLCAPGSRERAIGDIARIFSGKIIFGEELKSYELW
jgi:ribonuclease Z